MSATIPDTAPDDLTARARGEEGGRVMNASPVETLWFAAMRPPAGEMPWPTRDDVVKCVDRLYRQRRITLAHARILRIWGERQCAPSPRIPEEAGDARLWREAMQELDARLRLRGAFARSEAA